MLVGRPRCAKPRRGSSSDAGNTKPRSGQTDAEVQTAFAQLVETDKVLAVYRQTILPAARQYSESAQGNYSANTLDFLHLIDAQRRLIQLREKYEEALAEREQRWAELQRAVGGSWPRGADPEVCQPGRPRQVEPVEKGDRNLAATQKRRRY